MTQYKTVYSEDIFAIDTKKVGNPNFLTIETL